MRDLLLTKSLTQQELLYRPRMQSPTELRSTVFVGNIAVFCTEADLAKHFSSCGEIMEIRLALNEDKSKHLSYGFVRFTNIACAQLAIQTLNGTLLCGRTLKCVSQSLTLLFVCITLTMCFFMG